MQQNCPEVVAVTVFLATLQEPGFGRAGTLQEWGAGSCLSYCNWTWACATEVCQVSTSESGRKTLSPCAVSPVSLRAKFDVVQLTVENI